MSNAAPAPAFELQMIDYLRARLYFALTGDGQSEHSMPSWCPSAIRVERPIRGIWPPNTSSVIFPGDWPCTATLFGAIHAPPETGDPIAVDFFACEILAFRANAKREAVLASQGG